MLNYKHVTLDICTLNIIFLIHTKTRFSNYGDSIVQVGSVIYLPL